MARSLWSGSLSFGLINVPVNLYSAVRDQDLHFRQLHEKDGAPIETRRFCKQEDREVAYEEIAHGYERDDGGRVVLTDEELAAVAPRKTRTIDIDAFVDLEDVDPVYFDHPYWLAPSGDSEGTRRAYRLLLEVMGDTDRAALGRFVLRSKEYLVLIRARDGRLALTTMLFADEVAVMGTSHNGDHENSRLMSSGAKHRVAGSVRAWRGLIIVTRACRLRARRHAVEMFVLHRMQEPATWRLSLRVSSASGVSRLSPAALASWRIAGVERTPRWSAARWSRCCGEPTGNGPPRFWGGRSRAGAEWQGARATRAC